MLNIYEKFRRRVIELNHPECNGYEEAVKKEKFVVGKSYYRQSPSLNPFLLLSCNGGKNEAVILDFKSGVINTSFNYLCDCEALGFSITLPRVMQALLDSGNFLLRYKYNIHEEHSIVIELENGETIIWKLTKENGVECTHLDQTKETIIKLN